MLAVSSPHRWATPPWSPALDFISRSPPTFCFAKRSIGGTLAARNADVRLRDRLAGRLGHNPRLLQWLTEDILEALTFATASKICKATTNLAH